MSPAVGPLRRGATRETISPRWAGPDVHEATVVAGIRRAEPNGRVRELVRTFGTLIRDLLALSDGLAERGVTHVASEATGGSGKPSFNLREGRFERLPVDPRHLKQVPGRETDVKDGPWIARLLRHGLRRGRFVPPQPIRARRDLTRRRGRQRAAQAAVAHRIQEAVEDADIERGCVATDVLGTAGRARIRRGSTAVRTQRLRATIGIFMVVC